MVLRLLGGQPAAPSSRNMSPATGQKQRLDGKLRKLYGRGVFEREQGAICVFGSESVLTATSRSRQGFKLRTSQGCRSPPLLVSLCLLAARLRLEGQNADRFRKNFSDVDWVKVPKVYWEFSGQEVLVLEYLPGTKINDGDSLDRLGLDRKRLARLSVESYLQQILRHGFFHADPVRERFRYPCKDGEVWPR